MNMKKFAHYLLVPKNQARPRMWVRLIVNPLVHINERGSKICRSSRMDVLPFRGFFLGKNSTIEDFTTVNNGVGDVYVGDNTRIGLGSVLIGPISIGNNVMFAQNIVASGLNHGFEDVRLSPVNQKCTSSKIVVEDDVWIGANSVITAGVHIGRHSVVGAGSVVTKDVPPFTVVAGNPARIIKQYDAESGTWKRVHEKAN